MKHKKRAKLLELLHNFTNCLEEDSSSSSSDENELESSNETPRKEVDQKVKALFQKYETPGQKTNLRGKSAEQKKKKKKTEQPAGIFTVVLLEDNERDTPLNKKEFSDHANKGLVKEPVSLSRNISCDALYQKLKDVFIDRLSTVKFTILKKMGDKLIAPSLPSGAELDGSNFTHVFYRKTVLLRPHSSILVPSSSSASEPSNVPIRMKSPAMLSPVYTVVLLEDSLRDTPPNKKELSDLTKQGLLKEPVPLSKNLSADALHAELHKLFIDRLSTPQFTILKKIGEKLVAPPLPKGEELDGSNFSFVFHRKTVYLRSHKAILTNTNGASGSSALNYIDSLSSSDEEVSPSKRLNNVKDVSMVSDDDDHLQDVIYHLEEESRSATNEINDPDIIDISDDVVIETSGVSHQPSDIHNEVQQQGRGEIDAQRYRDVVAPIVAKVNIGQNRTIKIMRGCVLQSLLTALKTNFCETKGIFFKFLDCFGLEEAGIDNSGLSKEVFSLAFEEVRLSLMFEGPPYEGTLAIDYDCERNRNYFYVGLMIALSIAHHLPSPKFFSPELFSAIVSGKFEREPVLDYVMDIDIKNQIAAIEKSRNLQELQTSVYDSPFIATLGVSIVKSFTHKRSIVRGALNLALNTRLQPAFSQLLEGLAALGVLEVIRREPTVMRQVFVRNEELLTASKVKAIFKMDWSRSSAEKDLEAPVYLNFINFLDKVEDGLTAVHLSDLLKFVTGHKHLPPGGFVPQPVLSFNHEVFGWRPLPIANVCGCVPKLPVINYSPEDFQAVMEEAIQTETFARA